MKGKVRQEKNLLVMAKYPFLSMQQVRCNFSISLFPKTTSIMHKDKLENAMYLNPPSRVQC